VSASTFTSRAAAEVSCASTLLFTAHTIAVVAADAARLIPPVNSRIFPFAIVLSSAETTTLNPRIVLFSIKALLFAIPPQNISVVVTTVVCAFIPICPCPNLSEDASQSAFRNSYEHLFDLDWCPIALQPTRVDATYALSHIACDFPPAQFGPVPIACDWLAPTDEFCHIHITFPVTEEEGQAPQPIETNEF
jgi:hypothetical protein